MADSRLELCSNATMHVLVTVFGDSYMSRVPQDPNPATHSAFSDLAS
jgi:hypothetical protein